MVTSHNPKSRTSRLLPLAGLCLWLGAAPAWAATLSGRVRDNNTGSYLLGATVTVRELARDTSTDRAGSFTLRDVPAGSYTLVTSYLGYGDVTQTVTVAGDGERAVDIAMGAELVRLGSFMVEGNREGQARALQQKRTADNIMDVVSSDSAGKLPDGNAAEAVRRLPGVFAEIDQNEGRYIVVRGIDANLNNITINGVSVGSTEAGGRGAGMDAVPADLISRIEVVKAVTPDMDAQAIGASINIVTPSAFDHAEPFAYGTLAGGYFNGPRGEFRDRKLTPYSGSATAGTTFGGGKWGAVIGGSYNFRHYISNRRSGGNPWFPAAAAGTPGADTYFPANEALFHYDVQRWRQGLNAALEYRPDANNQFYLRISDNRFKDEEGRNQNNYSFFLTSFPASFTPTSAHFATGQSTVEYRYYLQKHNITNYSVGGKNTLGDGGTRLDYSLAVGEAEKRTPDRQDWEFRSAANAFPSDLDISKKYWTVTPSANFYDAASFPFRRVRYRQDDEKEENLAATLNLRRDLAMLGHEGYWQIGGKYFDRDKSWNRTNADYNAGTGANLFNLSQFNIAEPAPELFGGDFKMSPQINLKAAKAFFAANPQYFVFNAAGTQSDSFVTDFKLKEKIGAAYAMAHGNFSGLSVLAGLRVENTKADVTQTELPTAAGATLPPRLNQLSKTYTNVLPGVHLRYAIRKEWIVRAAWTNTIGRPNYPDMAGASSFTYAETATGSGVYTGSLTSGNPGLKPYESRNFDLTSEYYFKNAGIFSISGFDKQIDNPVFTNAYTQRNTTYEGLNFLTLAYSRPENATSGKIRGVEFNYQQQLTMLPSPFDGLGFSVNYTMSDSEERLFTRPTESLPFAKQADKIYNAALFYEKYGFQARLAYTYTGPFIKAFGSDLNSDQYQAQRKIIDAKISYRINRNLTVFADVINLGEEPLDEYAGFANRNQATESYWWTANFGIHWKM